MPRNNGNRNKGGNNNHHNNNNGGGRGRGGYQNNNRQNNNRNNHSNSNHGNDNNNDSHRNNDNHGKGARGGKGKNGRGGRNNHNSGNGNNNYSNHNNRHNQNHQNSSNNNRHQGNSVYLPDFNKEENWALRKAAKEQWQEGGDIHAIADWVLGKQPRLHPVKWQTLSEDVIWPKLNSALLQLLTFDGLVDTDGKPLPHALPPTLQKAIAEQVIQHGRTSAWDIQKEVYNKYGYDLVYAGWTKPNAVASIGHWIANHMYELQNVVDLGLYVDPPFEFPDAEMEATDEESEQASSPDLLEELAAEASLLPSYRAPGNPNYVTNEWAYRPGTPKFGHASKFGISQAGKHGPNAPDRYYPNPVAPVRDPVMYPRKCQGHYGCSRHCDWNVDFRSRNGWSQHLMNNRYGICMYMDNEGTESFFEDAEGDIIMTGNSPPWLHLDADGRWEGTFATFSRNLRTEPGADGAFAYAQ